MMLPESQRWTEKVFTWKKSREVCDTRALEVEVISEAEARAFVTTHHYSASYPSARFRVGLFQRGALVGCAVFGVPAGPTVLQARTGFDHTAAIELSRFVLLDEVAYNAETWFFKRARGALVSAHPELKALLAYSDPQPRRAREGALVLLGHVGDHLSGI